MLCMSCILSCICHVTLFIPTFNPAQHPSTPVPSATKFAAHVAEGATAAGENDLLHAALGDALPG